MTAPRLLIAVISLQLLVGCAHVPFRTRVARTLMVLGGLAIVGGGLVAAGCKHEGETANSVCSGGPQDADPETGLPVMVLGGAALVVGVTLGTDDPKAPYSPRSLQPVPWDPDAFIPTFPQYPHF
ncbi:MAG: hypothetical protein JWN48_1457 [Myxococcaceae bacterium]|nr:hypothetical protein [Myxococcaceae bacterium]